MLDKIKQYFKDHLDIADTDNPITEKKAIQLACAALLIETSQSDFLLLDEETRAIRQLVREQFNLDPVEVDALLKMAREEVRQSSSLYQFTRLVNDYYDYQQKMELLNAMWRVAFADYNLDKHEEHLIRKVSDLIYVSHKDFIRLKVAAQVERSDNNQA